MLGTYNSGSTPVAGMLHRLGADMGAPFWLTSDKHSANNNYEPYDIAVQLRRWWNEPGLYATDVTRDQRREYLHHWMLTREAVATTPAVGVKHPLTIMSTRDFQDAWGEDLLFLWTRRPLEDAIKGLAARRWFERPDMLQAAIYSRIELFAAEHPVEVVDWGGVRSDPEAMAKWLCSTVGLHPDPGRIRLAADFVRNPPQPEMRFRDRVHWAGLAMRPHLRRVVDAVRRD